MRTRLLGWLILGAIVAPLVFIPVGGAVAWLIVDGRKGLSAGDQIAAIAIGVTIGVGVATVISTTFGPPLFQRWIDNRHPAKTAASKGPVARARQDRTLGERNQDRLAMREVFRGMKSELFPKNDS